VPLHAPSPPTPALRGRAREDVSLSRFSSFRIGGPARHIVAPADAADLDRALAFARGHGLPWHVLGNGTNTLFPDRGYPGVVIHLGPGGGLSGLALRGERLWVQAGASLAAARALAEARGFDDLGFTLAIPGTVGGALAMNAGVPEGTIGELVASVRARDPAGRLRRLGACECAFGYRKSRFRGTGWLVLEAELRLGGGRRWDRAALLERRKRQPLGHSPGCVFKNPPHIPHSAGWLVDKAGLKGYKVGNAQVSRSHANFILNLGDARSADVLALIDIVREKVYKEFKVELDLELEVVYP